jgi:hypothetical protein
LTECRDKKGIFLVATHYWELGQRHQRLNRSVGDLLEELIDRGKALEADFVRVSDVFSS